MKMKGAISKKVKLTFRASEVRPILERMYALLKMAGVPHNWVERKFMMSLLQEYLLKCFDWDEFEKTFREEAETLQRQYRREQARGRA